MKQMTINPAMVVNIELSGVAELLKPVVFKEGTDYCCLLGPDPQTGVMGCGDTPESAVTDWNNRLKKHLASAGKDDIIVNYVESVLDAQPKPPHIQAFYDQFRTVKK